MNQLDLKDPYHLLFLEEAREQVDLMEQDILSLESNRFDEEVINHFFRMAHSLKGSSSTLELESMVILSHHLESFFMDVKSKKIVLEGNHVEVALEAVDSLKAIVHGLSSGLTTSINIDNLLERLNELSKTPQIATFQESLSSSKKYKVHVVFDVDTMLVSIKVFLLVQAFELIGRVYQTEPSNYELLEDDVFNNEVTLHLETKANEKEIYEALSSITEINKIEVSVINGVANEVEISALPTTPSNLISHNEEKSTIRVSAQKVNQLINLVGELIIDKEALHKLSKNLKVKYKKDADVNRLLDVFLHIQYLSSELQELALSTRMIPLEHIFNKFPRMVRDLSNKCNKSVRFEIEGKETGIDRGIIEELVDPITHLLRNAVDHGMDDVETRMMRGKPPMGLIRLTAGHGENNVIISLSDDGNGIDINKIKQKFLNEGLMGQEECDQLCDQDWLETIFNPGFSTAETVSDISGRGVGLDVVKSNISKLGGIIDIQTELGKGTTFSIKLPLTLAIIKAMLIKEGLCTFAVPLASIIEIIRIKGKADEALIYQVPHHEVFSWREQVLPLVRLNQYFDIQPETQRVKSHVLVVGHSEKRIALLVDQIMGEQEIVIKSIGDFIGPDKIFGELHGIAGVSILGDGSFAQIIDIAEISSGEYHLRRMER